MKDMRIARKLMAMFSIVGLLVTLVTGILIYQLHALDSVSGALSDEQYPQSSMAEDINTATSDYEVALQAYVLSTGNAAEVEANRRIADRQAFVERTYEELGSHSNTAAEKQLLGAFHAKWTRYVALAHQVMALSAQARDEEAATALESGQGLFDSLSSDLLAYGSYQDKEARRLGAEADSTFRTGMIIAFVMLALALGTLGFILAALVRAIAQPLERMTVAMGEMAAGNRQVDVPVEPRADEVGDLAKAMAGFRDQLALAEAATQEQARLLVSSVGAALGELATGNLTARVHEQLSGAFTQLKDDFNNAAAQLEGSVNSVAGSASGIRNGASEIRAASDDLAQRTQQQASSLERTAASMKQITAMVQETAQSAAEVQSFIGEAHGRTDQGREVVTRAVAAMAAIEQSSREIGSIVNVIDGIAFQTNLLALNAGVEAARAGDAGKGFAVVATEVRALAQRSADAAQEIKGLIARSGGQVEQGVALVGNTGQVLGEIADQVARVNELVGSIAAAADRQATGIGQVNSTIVEMDRVTQQNAAMVEESTAAARSLACESDELADIVARFRISQDGNGLTIARSTGARGSASPSRNFGRAA